MLSALSSIPLQSRRANLGALGVGVRQEFTKQNRHVKAEKQSGERPRGHERRWVKAIESRNTAANFLSPTGSSVDNAGWQPLPLTTNHSFCIVNKQFKRTCQPSNRKSSSSYNVFFLLPVYAATARLPGKWRTGWVMRMARTTCSVGGDNNEGWHDAVYSPSRQCGLTQYFSHLLTDCWSE